jgi:hypothetical protein
MDKLDVAALIWALQIKSEFIAQNFYHRRSIISKSFRRNQHVDFTRFKLALRKVNGMWKFYTTDIFKILSEESAGCD